MAWQIFNNQLLDCKNKGIEPSWAKIKWYGKTAVLRDAVDDPNHPTAIKLEDLVQTRAKKDRLDDNLRGESLDAPSAVLFDKSARVGFARIGLPKHFSVHRLKHLRFDEGATIVKLAFLRVSKCKGDICPISVVQDSHHPSDLPAPERQFLWLSRDTSKPCKLSSAVPEPVSAVPINCFYYIVQNLNSGKSGHYKDRADLLRTKYEFQRDDQLYLLAGFHVMKDDVPNWTWATYWWTLKPTHRCECDENKTNRPIGCEYPWSFFEMDAFRYEKTMEPNRDVRPPIDPGIRYNIYIEKSEALQSNCVYCHARAMYRRRTNQGYGFNDQAKGGIRNDDQVLPCRGVPPESADPHPFPCDHGAIPTQFLWSLAGKLEGLQPPAKPSP